MFIVIKHHSNDFFKCLKKVKVGASVRDAATIINCIVDVYAALEQSWG